MVGHDSNGWNLTSVNHSVPQSESSISCLFIAYRRSAIEGFYGTYVVSIVLNLICALPASVLNFLVMLAVWKKTQLHTPSNVLLSNLALTDFGVGFFIQPIFVAHKFGAIYGNVRLHCIASLISGTLASVLGAVSLTTLTAISIDRLLALVLSVRYRTVVNVRRTATTVVFLWIISVIVTIPLFIYPMSFVYCMILLLVVCLTVTTLAYARLLRLIQRHRCRIEADLQASRLSQASSHAQLSQVTQHNQPTPKSQLSQDPQQQADSTTVAKYRSSTRTVIWLVFLMIIFYSPYLILNIVLAVKRTGGDRFKAAFNIAHTILFMNSLANPAFYCWKIRSIRKAILEICSDIWPE